MKILVVGNYFYPEHTGGVEIVSHNLVKYYGKFSQAVRWMAADVPSNFRKKSEHDIAIRAWNFTEEQLGFPSPIPYPADLPKLYAGIKWCDVVHLQDCLYPINILVFMISRRFHKPVLITQYAKFIPYNQFYKRALQALAYYTIGKWMLSMAERVAFITENVRDNMRFLNPRKLNDVVPLGVDTDFYAPLPPSERSRFRENLCNDSSIPIILFVGRMVERKGIHLLRPLVDKHKEWHWVFVGRPDDFNPNDWKAPNLTYYQNAPEQLLKKLYSAADLLVHPSVGEGLTLIASESLASGTPVVISHESLYEVNENDHSLFFAVQPATADIEDKLLRALSDRQRLGELGIACRKYALKRLSWERMAERYLSILHEILLQQ